MMVHREERGTDIMTPEGMDEAFSLYKKFFDIKVTTKNGLTYTTQDLCDRGGTPDNPSMPVEMPCMISDPFQCFSEYLEATPASYQQYIDPYIDDPPMSNIFASIQPKSFKSRPGRVLMLLAPLVVTSWTSKRSLKSISTISIR